LNLHPQAHDLRQRVERFPRHFDGFFSQSYLVSTVSELDVSYANSLRRMGVVSHHPMLHSCTIRPRIASRAKCKEGLTFLSLFVCQNPHPFSRVVVYMNQLPDLSPSLCIKPDLRGSHPIIFIGSFSFPRPVSYALVVIVLLTVLADYMSPSFLDL